MLGSCLAISLALAIQRAGAAPPVLEVEVAPQPVSGQRAPDAVSCVRAGDAVNLQLTASETLYVRVEQREAAGTQRPLLPATSDSDFMTRLPPGKGLQVPLTVTPHDDMQTVYVFLWRPKLNIEDVKSPPRASLPSRFDDPAATYTLHVPVCGGSRTYRLNRHPPVEGAP